MIVDKVSESTGYQVDWKGISAYPVASAHITVSDLTVSANDQKIISIKSADIEVALFPLLSKNRSKRHHIGRAADDSGNAQKWSTDMDDQTDRRQTGKTNI